MQQSHGLFAITKLLVWFRNGATDLDCIILNFWSAVRRTSSPKFRVLFDPLNSENRCVIGAHHQLLSRGWFDFGEICDVGAYEPGEIAGLFSDVLCTSA